MAAPTTLPLSRSRVAGLLAALLAFLAPLALDVPGLDEPGERMLAIFLMAIVLFVSEAIPLVATAVLVIFLEVLMLTEQALLPLAEPAASSREIWATLADPVIILFLGGFLIADGAAKYALDRNLAALILTPFRSDARRAMLALILMTAVLSMFMSNTATTATMFAVLLPVLAGLPSAAARTGFALAVPVAANVGGIGTPVGSPPNAIALGALAAQGETISFISWMVATVPLMLLLLLLAWAYLGWRYVPARTPLALNLSTNFDRSPAAIVFYLTAGATVLLWLTEAVHGIPSTTVGFLPVVVLLATTVMTGDDVRALQWPVLWLVAGGIALGHGVASSGLDDWLIGLVDWSMLPPAMLLLVLAGMALLLSAVISNSAMANLLIPIALALAGTLGLDMVLVALVVAVACGLGMFLPVSTPPNAIAYATGTVTTAQMAVAGAAVGVPGTLVLALVLPHYWSWIGI
ncbi:SLC13 family permease [Ornithinimicrobium pratense]|uniref:DASS family sodium-coupled anion symporter n=1 Tax=Ornithinimicrobium pratense TaxID=2593973 RepID=A0A5J6V1J6_9MICO|nr:DASS family sodium-coupled anion symporter [Ornithinimicrobium pratense]QFG67458.1 DASS family sodium-coupled anion symporter [Ornithinimicrobium pratense]